jgi:hypothetical protein
MSFVYKLLRWIVWGVLTGFALVKSAADWKGRADVIGQLAEPGTFGHRALEALWSWPWWATWLLVLVATVLLFLPYERILRAERAGRGAQGKAQVDDAYLSFEAHYGLPSERPASDRFYMLCPYHEQEQVGLAISTGPQGRMDWGGALGGYECRITNHGSAPLFKVKLPIEIQWWATITEGNSRKATGDVKTSKGEIRVPRLSPGPEHTFVFYFCNYNSDHFATLIPFSKATADIGAEQNAREILVRVPTPTPWGYLLQPTLAGLLIGDQANAGPKG